MSDNKDAVRRLLAAFGSADATGLARQLDELLAPEFVAHAGALAPDVDRLGAKQAVLAIKDGFPDAAAELLQLAAAGSKAMVHARIEGSHEQDWAGVPATHRRVAWTVTGLLHFDEAGRLAEAWVIQDTLGLLQQLGRIARIPGQGG